MVPVLGGQGMSDNMMSDKGTVLVAGATGQQGGAVARRLLAAGWHVRALTRNGDTPAARALVVQGAELAIGEMGNRSDLDAAIAGAHGVFSVQPTAGGSGTPPGYTIADEVRLGIAVADAAHRAGVAHLVYSSVAGAERDSGISKWESKWRVERHIAELGIPATILRPVRFMENHLSSIGGIRGDVLTDVFEPTALVQMIAIDDIGAFAQLAFDDPDLYLGQAIEIAGDELTMPQVADAIGRVLGRAVGYRKLPRERAEQIGGDAIAGYVFANEGGAWIANIAALRAHHPGLITHDQWLEVNGLALTSALSAKSSSAP